MLWMGSGCRSANSIIVGSRSPVTKTGARSAPAGDKTRRKQETPDLPASLPK